MFKLKYRLCEEENIDATGAAEGAVAEGPETEVEPETEEVNPFEELAIMDDNPEPVEAFIEEELVAEETPVVEETPTVETPVVETPEVKVEESKVEEVAPVVEALPEEKPREEAPQQTVDEIRTEAIQKLTEHYAFSEEQAELVRTEPEKLIPQLAAQLMVDMQQNMGQMLTQYLPQMMQQVNDSTKAEQDAKTGFYGEWPELDKPEYTDVLNSISSTHRSLNPDMGTDQFSREVAAMAFIRLQIPFDPATGKALSATTEAVSETVVTPSRMPAGSTAAPTSVPKQMNEFELLSQELIDSGEM